MNDLKSLLNQPQLLEQTLLVSQIISDLTQVQLRLLDFHQECKEIATNNGLLNGKQSPINGYLNGNKDSDDNPEDIPF